MLSATIAGLLLNGASANVAEGVVLPPETSEIAAPAVRAERAHLMRARATSQGSERIERSAPVERRVTLSVSRAANVDLSRRGTIQIVSTRPPPVEEGETATGPLLASIPRGSPLASAYVSSRYGRRLNPVTGVWSNHSGIDLAAARGTPVFATAGGVVTNAGWRGGYGILVVVRHGNGVETRYAHLSGTAVSVGSRVRDGDVLGYVGSTGRSTGPHLHYEIRRNGASTNPYASLGR